MKCQRKEQESDSILNGVSKFFGNPGLGKMSGCRARALGEVRDTKGRETPGTHSVN